MMSVVTLNHPPLPSQAKPTEKNATSELGKEPILPASEISLPFATSTSSADMPSFTSSTLATDRRPELVGIVNATEPASSPSSPSSTPEEEKPFWKNQKVQRASILGATLIGILTFVRFLENRAQARNSALLNSFQELNQKKSRVRTRNR